MNPFVNPNKRSISLPKGCKDLIDVLQPPCQVEEDAVHRFIMLLLFQAQQDCATELVIGPATRKGTPIKYKVEDAWHEMGPFPSRIRPAVVAELARMAAFPEGAFPKEGPLYGVLGSVVLQWKVRITDAEGDCVLTPVPK
jgi:hypothetical protein